MTETPRFMGMFSEQSEQSEQIPPDQEAGTVLDFVSRGGNKANKLGRRRRWVDRATDRASWTESTPVDGANTDAVASAPLNSLDPTPQAVPPDQLAQATESS